MTVVYIQEQAYNHIQAAVYIVMPHVPLFTSFVRLLVLTNSDGTLR